MPGDRGIITTLLYDNPVYVGPLFPFVLSINVHWYGHTLSSLRLHSAAYHLKTFSASRIIIMGLDVHKVNPKSMPDHIFLNPLKF